MSSQFKHSVKVPRLYKIAAKKAKDHSEGLGGIKQLVYGETTKHPNLKAIFSLLTTLFQKSQEIETLLKRSKILEKESRLDPWLTKILIVELLWGKGALPGQSKPESTVRGYEQIFKAHLTDQATDRKTEGPYKPRYVRVNTISLSTAEAIQNFQDEEWQLSNFTNKNDYDGFLQKISTLEEGQFMVDIHIPDLLIFPRKTEFHHHPAYKKGSILLQDKASCLPVHILAPPPGSVVLDMCAAPGMKTTHLAAVVKNEGTIYAVEQDAKRYKILEGVVADAGATCVKTINKDVLQCTSDEFPNLEYILVDPSCTGTGMADRYYSTEKINPERLQKLAGFQIKILRAALTKYPGVKRVVYSTCSILPEENEDVVRQVLETNYNFKLVPGKQFIDGAWKNFGSSDYGEMGAYCLYSKPDEDFTNGFFVAVFERLAEGEENKFFNHKIYSYKRGIDKKERRKAKKLERIQNETEENEAVEGEDDKEEHELSRKRKQNDADDQKGEIDLNNADAASLKKKKKGMKASDNSDSKNEDLTNENTESEVIHLSKDKKKKKKDQSLEKQSKEEVADAEAKEPEEVLKKIKTKKDVKVVNSIQIADSEAKDQKKKNKEKDEVDQTVRVNEGSSEIFTKRKKKKNRMEDDIEQDLKKEHVVMDAHKEVNDCEETIEKVSRKKKKKNRNEEKECQQSPDQKEEQVVTETHKEVNPLTNVCGETSETVPRKKKKKSQRNKYDFMQDSHGEEEDAVIDLVTEEDSLIIFSGCEETERKVSMKKKKKKRTNQNESVLDHHHIGEGVIIDLEDEKYNKITNGFEGTPEEISKKNKKKKRIGDKESANQNKEEALNNLEETDQIVTVFESPVTEKKKKKKRIDKSEVIDPIEDNLNNNYDSEKISKVLRKCGSDSENFVFSISNDEEVHKAKKKKKKDIESMSFQ